MKLKRSDVANIWRNINSIVYDLYTENHKYVFNDDTYDIFKTITIRNGMPYNDPNNQLEFTGFIYSVDINLQHIGELYRLVWIQYSLTRGIHVPFNIQYSVI